MIRFIVIALAAALFVLACSFVLLWWLYATGGGI